MFPYGYPTDAFGGGNLLVAASVIEAQAEDALLLFRQVAGHYLIDVRQPLVLNVGLVSWLCKSVDFKWNRDVAQPLKALVTDARQQIAFLCVRPQDGMPMKQVLEDVADHILAFLLIVEDGACHPEHLGIMLTEQLMDSILFHNVFINNTHQLYKKLTLCLDFG